MTRRITLNYDAATGSITGNGGEYIGSFLDLQGHDATTQTLSVDDLIALKKADFTVDEIAELKRQKLIA